MTTIDRPFRALKWAEEMFGLIALDPRERTMRFLEEAIELAHASGLEVSMVEAITGRVYGSPQGLLTREIGQSLMTLEILAKNLGIDADHEASEEFQRVQRIPKKEWQRRHAAKVAIGIATQETSGAR